MESNRDEAERCIEISLSAIKEQQLDRARRFLEKAQRLFPTEKAQRLLESISQNGTTHNSNNNCGENEDGGFRHRTTNSTEQTPQESGTDGTKPYTAEQLDAVKRIKKCKDYYEILGVSKDASDDDLKKAYRKLALKFHPDKNHAPGATEAFKAIGNAYAILSNTEKRKQYDLYGEERVPQSRHGHSHRNFEADISPEDLFNMFFGGGFPSSNVHVYNNSRMRFGHNHRHEQQEQQRDGSLALMVQLMPIFILILVSALSQLIVSSPPYSLSHRPSSGHTNRRQTANLKVPYYVGDRFSEEYTEMNLKNIEDSVEDDYISNLRNNCWKEKQQKEGLLYRARYFGDSDLYQRAQKMGTPSCSKLSDIQVILHGH